MRLMLALALMTTPAAAQQVWTPAPVPNISPPSVPPSERANTGSEAASGAIFSGAPVTQPGASSGGQTSPADRDTPGSTAAGTPPLSK